ncbi:cell division protein FtsL [Pseudoneobacillus sp. C159]
MSNLARKYQQETKGQPQKKRQPLNQPKEKFFRVTPGEKVLGLLFGTMVCFGAVHLISAQASIYEMNKDITSMETAIQEQKKVNKDLMIEKKELSNYERIMSKASERGMKLKDNNVKVVREK